MDLFNQPAISENQVFYNSHGAENNSHSEAIYEKQAKRLSRNTRIILQCLIDGRKLSGRDCINGITCSTGEFAQMIEFRKRFDEIKRAGIVLGESKNESGCKTWWLGLGEILKARQLL